MAQFAGVSNFARNAHYITKGGGAMLFLGQRRRATRSSWDFGRRSWPVEALEHRRLLAAAQVVSLASWNASGTDSPNTGALLPSISDDGRYEVYESGSTDIVPGMGAGAVNVYLRDRMTNTTKCLSLDPSGTHSGNHNSHYPIISGNGRYVVFVSEATNLVPLDNPGNNPDYKDNIMVRDLATDTTKLVSVNYHGTGPGDRPFGGDFGISTNPTISADGRYVAYQSDAVDLAPNDNNGRTDVFLRNMQTNTTYLVSEKSDGSASGDSTSNEPVISADGSTIAFESLANNLDPSYTNFMPFSNYQVYAYHVATHSNTLVTYDTTGAVAGNDTSVFPSLSANGQVIAFQSWASNLVTTPLNNSSASPDVYVRYLGANPPTTQLVSMNASATASGDDSSFQPNISADGNHVLFSSYSNDLVSNDHDDTQDSSKDVFERNLLTQTTQLVSVNASGSDSGNNRSTMANETFVNPAQQSMGTISSDGRYAIFISRATDIIPGFVKQNDPIYGYDLYLRDTVAGTTTLISHQVGTTNRGGGAANIPSGVASGTAAMTPDGKVVAFQSPASNLVPKDTNGGVNQTDVFSWGQGASSPPPTVKPARVQLVYDKKNKQLLRQVIVYFSGSLGRSGATNKANYRLALTGSGGSFDAKNAPQVKFGAPSYDANKKAVTLTLSSGLTLKTSTKVQLRITSKNGSGLTDSQGNPIDGDHNGQVGGNVIALIRLRGASLA
jgi:hypothetical protein